MYKKLLFLLLIGIAASRSYAQNYDVLTYAFNGTATNGVKIKTNLPFTDGSQMPTLIFEGYNYVGSSPVGLLLTYYIYNGAFINARVSSYGTYTPPIYLANEGGKVVIFIDSKDYYLRFSLRAFGRDRSAETATNYQGWTTADEALLATATAKLLVPYQNQFSGKVSIGTSAPQAGLHVTNVNTLPNGELAAAVLGNAYNHWTYFGSTSGGKIRGSSEGYLALETNPSGTNKNLYLNVTSPGNILMAGGGGNVGVGTSNPGSYKLAVKGTIGAQKVKVTQTGWADFVFEPAYNLPSLAELETFIHVNKHLPDVPTEQEVVSEGLDLGEMDKKLLQKIEELTLYLIDQNKKIETQQEMIETLKTEVSQLKASVQ
ncbi:hypothetical protein [Chitinophaga japonensis]|uniref:Uncharacterized protein n=1 Tax=Chitinophaga japonensis TaxID=104662 RepID=A0A562TAJ3_CHIJA|nr:hypothetical protein [Chitinophaga japonensis]TWI90645.1 hypothetical protein LX66_0005 [Chitinophaga japonensis]